MVPIKYSTHFDCYSTKNRLYITTTLSCELRIHLCNLKQKLQALKWFIYPINLVVPWFAAEYQETIHHSKLFHFFLQYNHHQRGHCEWQKLLYLNSIDFTCWDWPLGGCGGDVLDASLRVFLHNWQLAHTESIQLLCCANVSKALIAKGANVNAADSNGWTALSLASEEGHLTIAKVRYWL